MKKWLIGFFVLVLAVVTGAGAGIIFNSGTVFAGVKVDGHDLGGLNRMQMEKWLREQAAGVGKTPLTFYYQDVEFIIDAKQIEYAIDMEATADSVWRYGREGLLWHRVKSIYYARTKGYEVPVSIRYSEERLKKLFEQWAQKIDRPAKNASLSLDTGNIISEQMGRQMDHEVNREQLLRALRERNGRVPIIVQEVPPHINAADIEKSGVKDLLGIYTTYFNNSDINRTSNIRLAVDKINGTLLQPGEVFSYNAIVGPRDVRHGFKEALEIVNGEFVSGIGGGVCQVSSTLYNAVLYAGLQIVERTNHAKPLSYVPAGRDATVVYGYLDFQFANNSTAPILLLAEIEGGQLKMGVFGKKVSDETVKIAVVDQKEIPPGITKKEDPTLYVGETKVEKPGIPGYEATALRIWTINGKEVRREFLSKDKYLPTNTIVRVGTKPRPDPLDLPPAATTMAPAKSDAGKKENEVRGPAQQSPGKKEEGKKG
jgi:vancomycin resistance protein YoaR